MNEELKDMSWYKFMMHELIKTDRNKTIKNLALSTLEEMINLGFTNEEYEYFKCCMDKKVKTSKFTL